MEALPEEKVHHPVAGCRMLRNPFDNVRHVGIDPLFHVPWPLILEARRIGSWKTKKTKSLNKTQLHNEGKQISHEA